MAVAQMQRTTQTTVYSGAKKRIRIWFAIVIVFVIWVGCTAISQMERHAAAESKLAAAQQKIDEAKLKSAALNEQIKRLNDPEYIAQLATKNQGLVSPGEQSIEYVD